MSLNDQKSAELNIRIPSHRRTLGDAARLERVVLLILRDIFPNASEWIATGESGKPVVICFEDEGSFIDTIVQLRKTHAGMRNHNPDSLLYNSGSVPNLYTTMNSFFTPSPRDPRRPHPDDSVSWSIRFSLGSSEAFYEHVDIKVPYALMESNDGVEKIKILLKRLVEALDPEDARFAINYFDRAFWKVRHRIGWMTYFSQSSICEYLIRCQRVFSFHRGIILQLSDDPADMLNDEFIRQAFEFAQSLVPHWPSQLKN